VTDENDDFEGFKIIEGGEPTDDEVVPGRSVFGDDDVSFDEDDAALPHWSEPATGVVPQVGGPDPEPEPPAVDDGAVGDDATAAFEGVSDPDGVADPEPVQIATDDDDLAAWAEVSSTPQWADDHADLPPVATVGEAPDAADDFFGYDDDVPPDPVADETTSLGAALGGSAPAGGADRNVPMAIAVGVGLAALILAAMWIGPAAAMVVVTIALGLAAVEYFNAVRVAGHQPAVLLGLATVVGMPLAVYWRGESAMPMVLVLSVIFGALWYLLDVGSGQGIVRGLGTTFLGILHIGLLGSFAALLLSLPTVGTGMLTAAVLVTVAYDVGGLVVGRSMGRSPLNAASPNKTMEGLVGGCVAAVAVGAIIGLVGPSPFGDGDWGGGFIAGVLLGIAAALAAPVGDLAESLIKRDLGVKDMGSVLPGHGGVLDRFDALLFVLPTTYYVARLLDVGVPS